MTEKRIITCKYIVHKINVDGAVCGGQVKGGVVGGEHYYHNNNYYYCYQYDNDYQ